MDPRVPNESASLLMARLKLDKVQNPLYQFLELALSSKNDSLVQKKINQLIQQGYDINFSSLCNIPNTQIYFCGPAALVLPLYVSENNKLSACNRLITNGGSINHLAMGFAISGQVSQAEKLRTQYQADASLIYMGYVLHDLYQQSNLNPGNLAHPSITIASLEQIKNLIDYYEKQLLSPQIASIRKRRASLKMGDWKTECPISESFHMANHSLESLQDIVKTIQSECCYLETYGRSDCVQAYLAHAISAFKTLQARARNQPINQASNFNEINGFLSNTIQSWSSYKIPITKLLLYPNTFQQGLDAYLEKSKTLSESGHLLLSICKELTSFSELQTLGYFYKIFKSILNDSENENKKEWAQELIYDAINVGNLAFAKQLRLDFPDCSKRSYAKKITIAKSAGETNLNFKDTHHWIYHHSIYEYLPLTFAIDENDLRAYFSGAFQRYPDILLSLQHLAQFRSKPNDDLPEDYYQIYIHELFKLKYGQLIKQSCDLIITEALSLTTQGAIILLAQMPIEFLKQAQIWFHRKMPTQTEIKLAWEESILSEAMMVKNIMSIFQADSEEAYYFKKIRDELLTEKNIKKNKPIDQASPKRHSFPLLNQEETPHSIQSLLYFLASSKALNHLKHQPEIAIGNYVIPVEIFLCIISNLWTRELPTSPLISTQDLMKKFIYRENRHLLFSPALMPEPLTLENNSINKKLSH